LITVVTTYYNWRDVPDAPEFSRCYTPEWVDKLYYGILRNYKWPFKFICLTNEPRSSFKERIETRPLQMTHWSNINLQLYGVEGRLVCMGLDTIIVGGLHEIFSYRGALALPRDPYDKERPCNAVVLMRGPRPDIVSKQGVSDMGAFVNEKFEWLDDLFPGQIVSYKGHVKEHGMDARIVYFHGTPKPHELHDPWIKECWR